MCYNNIHEIKTGINHNFSETLKIKFMVIFLLVHVCAKLAYPKKCVLSLFLSELTKTMNAAYIQMPVNILPSQQNPYIIP